MGWLIGRSVVVDKPEEARAKAIAKLLDKYRILGYVGVAIICYVAVEMVWDGGFQVLVATGLDETLHLQGLRPSH